jgi:hypothetical protein
MITSVFSILLSISIINTGVINNQPVGDINLPDTDFTQQTTLNSSTESEDSNFSYFLDVQLPKIQERSLAEEQRVAELDLAQQKAQQEQLAQIQQEQIRINQEVQRVKQEQEAQAQQQKAAQEKAQKALEAEQKKAQARTIAIPANTDYITLIRERCALLGCNSDQVIRVMYCESGGRHNAYNASSGASGLFQHMPAYWASRATTYGVPGADIWDPQAQIIVTTGMFSQGLASHWSCK